MSTNTLEKKARKENEGKAEKNLNSNKNQRESNQELGDLEYDQTVIDYRTKYDELATSLQEFYNEFKPFVMNEDIGDSLRKLLSEEKDNEPLLLVTYMKHSIKAINRFREVSTADSNTSPKANSTSQANDNQLEPLLQKAENDVRQHIRIEHQFRILVESLEQKCEELEKEKKNLMASHKSLMKETKLDNAKLSEIIRIKENEISNLNKSLKNKDERVDKDLSGIKSVDNKSRSQHVKAIQLFSDEIKQYYENELQMLNKQILSVDNVLAMNSPLDEKLGVLQRELYSIKDSALKKIQMIESKIKTLNDKDGFQDMSPITYHTNFRETLNENSDLKLQNKAFQNMNDQLPKPTTAYGIRKQPVNSNQNESRGNTEIGNFDTFRQKTQAQILRKILNEKCGEPESDKRMSSMVQKREFSKYSVNLSQSRDQRDPSFDLYFKQISRNHDTTTIKEKDRESPFRSFDSRNQSNSRVSTKITPGQDKLSRNYSIDKIKYDTSQGSQNKSTKQVSVVRQKGSYSNLRSSSTSNSALVRNSSWSVLNRK